MERYRILSFNHAGRVFAESTFEAQDESVAAQYAERNYFTGNGMGYEIRQGRTLIRRVIFAEARAP